jgi:hypothetical protein
MTSKFFTLAAVAGSLLIGTSASAVLAQDRDGRRGPPGGREVMFVRMLQQFDTNKDGKITKDEAKASGETLFVSIDADKDGSITPGEFRKHRETMREQLKAELKESAVADEDDADEVAPPPPGGPGDEQAQDDSRGPDGKPHHGKHHDGKRHGGRDMADRDGPRGPGDRGPGRMIRVADTDENGQINQAEAMTMVDKMFERADRNKDGVISVDDMPKRPMWMMR